MLLCLTFLCASPALPASDTDDVRAVLKTYLHGLKFNDVESFRKSFHPDAKLFFVKKDGSLGQLSQKQWYEGFETSAGKEEQGDLVVTSVEVTGKAASAKVIETYPGSKYTDYIALLKLADGWKIVNKIFVKE